MTTECHYLPHRPVFKGTSATTKIRPVFDASCKTEIKLSLNDCLEKGPNLIELIPSILLRFREKKIGIVSDIAKAFLQVGVKKQDRDYLRFLLWKDDKIIEMRHRRIVFGVTCSPFLLGAVLDFHIRSAPEKYKKWSEKLLKSLYVDNCVTSVDSVEELRDFVSLSTELMEKAKMDLRLWESNFWEVSGVGSLISRECGLDTGKIEVKDLSPVTTVLGLTWNKYDDILSIKFNEIEEPQKITKRSIFSTAQKIYDPLGFVAPITLVPKLIIQEAWLLKTGWDTELPQNFVVKIQNWLSEINLLNELKIPRCVSHGDITNGTLHVFCDASKYAYASVIYLRTEENGKVSVSFIIAKARVAPIKKITIPRLELLACLIGCRLAKSVLDSFGRKMPIVYWSDSTTVIAWIKRVEMWGTFVGNRVKEINEFSNKEDWRHVPGVLNPADLPSRGCSPKQLLECKWWEGPLWIQEVGQKNALMKMKTLF